MIEPIISTLTAISNAKAVLDLVVGVSRYVKRKSTTEDPDDMKRGVLTYAEKRHALEATYREWEHVAAIVEPAIGREISRHSLMPLAERAEILAKLAKEYAAVDFGSSPDKLDNVLLKHTAFVRRSDGKLELRFGQSEQTKYLRGESINIIRDVKSSATHQVRAAHEQIGGQMPLPVFKVTMLGDSGVGKTVFMSSMYAKLRDGEHGIAIRAINSEVDLELDGYITSLYSFSEWPPGTEGKIKTYDFELLLGKSPIAHIDWVDYRGGALVSSESDQSKKEEVLALVKRLQESHSILWMIDMSRLGNKPIHTMQARLLTRVQRMAQLSRQAIAGKNNLRSILFVRTKADEVTGTNGEPNWDLACDQLLDHIGRNNYGDISCAAAIPVSASGRINATVAASGATNAIDKQVLGDDPTNVEWPLIIALAFMLKLDLNNLDEAAENAYQTLVDARDGKLMQFVKDTLGVGMNDKQLQAIQNLEAVAGQVIGMRAVIGELLKNRPSSIKMFQNV